MTATTTEIVVAPVGYDGPMTHIVWVPDELRLTMTAQQYVFKARVEGFPVMALCGHTWIPSRNPESHPVCSRCVEIYKAGGNPETEGTPEDRSELPGA